MFNPLLLFFRVDLWDKFKRCYIPIGLITLYIPAVLKPFVLLSRRRATTLSFIATGFCCLMTGFLEHYGKSESAELAATAFAVFGKFFSSMCYSCIYIYSAELYPTTCRSTGFSSVVLSSRIASILVPFIVEGKFKNKVLFKNFDMTKILSWKKAIGLH